MEELREKKFEELDFTDNFMFCKIMETNPQLCQRMLELILNRSISKIVFLQKEDTHDLTPEGRSIRLDVYVGDVENTVYNVEMQVSKKWNLPKRMRYYQGMIDLNTLEKGNDYMELKKSYVIFICKFDYFKKGIPVYTFRNMCLEYPELELGDDTVKVFVNPYGEADWMSDDLRAFLNFLADGVSNGSNKFVDELASAVAAIRASKKWRMEYMTLMLEYRERYNMGQKEGRMAALMGSILSFLGDYGTVSDELKEKLASEDDPEILEKWVKLSARVSSVEEFEAKM